MFSTLFHPMFSTYMHLFLFLHEYSMVPSILVPIFLTTVFLLLHPSIILCLRFLTLFHIRFFYHISLFVFPVILQDRKSTRLNSSHVEISYAVFCLKKKRYLSA